MGTSESPTWNFSEHNAVPSAWLSATKMRFCLAWFLVEALDLDSILCTTAFQYTELCWELGGSIWLQWPQNRVHPTDRHPKHHCGHTKAGGCQDGQAEGSEPVCSAGTHRLFAVGCIVRMVTWPLLLPQSKNNSCTVAWRGKKSVPNASSPWFVYSCTSLMNDSLKSHRSHYVQYRGKCCVFTQVRAAKCNE